MDKTTKKLSNKTIARRQKVLQCALQCFTDFGVEGTTIDMIRDASGMSVGSLYHHFGNKERIASELFRAGMKDYASLVKHYLLDVFERSAMPSLEGAVKALVYANVDWISNNPQWAHFVFHHRHIVTVSGEEEAFKQDFSLFARMLGEFSAKLGITSSEKFDWTLISALVNGPTHSYARQWLAGRIDTPLTEHRQTFATAAWAAVASVMPQ